MTLGAQLSPVIARWSTAHAGLMLLGSAAVAAGYTPALLSACAAASFATLTYRCRGRWTHGGRFGAANAVTFLRLGGILTLPATAPLPAACFALVLFALDGADGWLARRWGLASDFGEYADKESDALLVLMLCALVHRLPGGPGMWVLAPGILRYLFVLLLTARPPLRREQRSRLAGWIAALMIFSLSACLATYPERLGHTIPLVAAMTLLLFGSFAGSAFRLYRAAGAGVR
jgi:phosphatidylglycerophosphate synthase